MERSVKMSSDENEEYFDDDGYNDDGFGQDDAMDDGQYLVHGIASPRKDAV